MQKLNIKFENVTQQVEKLEMKYEKISQKIEELEIEKSSLEESAPSTKEERRYFKIDDLIYSLEDKQYQIQLKIEELEKCN